MSLLLGLNYELFAIMLADSRITFATAPETYMDGCLKFNFFTGAGLIGWCGDIDTVACLMNSLAPISIDADDPWIVMDEARLRGRITDDVLEACPSGVAHFIIQLVQPLRSALGVFPQCVEMCVIDVVKSDDGYRWKHEVVPAGEYRIRGSGADIAPALDALNIALRTWVSPAKGRINEEGVLQRCLVLEDIVSGQVRKLKPRGVGGLFQMGYVLNDRVRGVSYEKWASCGNGYGTYVRMCVEEGRFVQLHPPTGRRYELLSPFNEHGLMQSRRGEDFFADLESLGPDDPGVKRLKGKRPPSSHLLVHGLVNAESTYRPLIIPVASSGG